MNPKDGEGQGWWRTEEKDERRQFTRRSVVAELELEAEEATPEDMAPPALVLRFNAIPVDFKKRERR